MDNAHGSNTIEATSVKPKTKRKRLGNTAADPTDATGIWTYKYDFALGHPDIQDADTAAATTVRKPQPRPRKRVRKDLGTTPEEYVPSAETAPASSETHDGASNSCQIKHLY